MLLLLEIIRELNKTENKNKFGGKLALKDSFIVCDSFISGKSYIDIQFVCIKPEKIIKHLNEHLKRETSNSN